MDKISVIIPVYNVEKYIHQCMESVLNQTYGNLEIILVDDGSPDNCGKICDDYASCDNRIKVIHKKNGGAPAARNDALAVATGKWIAYVDPDDWIELNEFEEVMNIAKRENPDVIIFNAFINKGNTQEMMQAFPDDFTTEDKTFISGLQLSALNKNSTPLLHNWSQGYPWDKIFKRSFLEEHNILWPTNVKADDDVIYAIHVFQFAKKVSYTNKTLYHWRTNPASIGHKYSPDRVAIDHDIHIEMLKIRDAYDLGSTYTEAFYCRVIYNVWNCCGRCFFHKDNNKPFSEKLDDISEMMQDDIISSAFKEADRSKLDRRIKLLALFKNPAPIWFFFAYKAYDIKERILN